MTTQTPPTPAQAAIFGSSSRILRRAEIYEADAVTFFQVAPGLLDGAVSVSYDRDERRTLDMSFDNTDKSLKHYPGGFWYDKIVKLYRGVIYNDASDLPTLMVADGVQNYWKLDETSGTVAADVTSGHAGTYVGTPLLGQAGRLGGTGAVGFNANTQYVQVADANDLSFTNNVFTLEFEALLLGVYGTKWGIAQKGLDFANQAEWHILANHYQNGAIGVEGFLLNGTALVSSINVPYTPEFWGHYAVVGDGVSLSMYKDGVLGTQIAGFTNFLQNGTSPLELGRATQGGTTYTMNGVLDNFGIYAKALSADQIAAHAAASRAGLNTSLKIWETQVGEFMIDSIESQNFPHTVHVTGRDYTKKLLVSKFTQATSFSQGQYVLDVIKTIATNGGISKFIFPSTSTTGYTSQLGKTWAWERGTERWKAIKDLAVAFGYEVYFDFQGNFVLRLFRDPVTSAEAFTFTTGKYGNLQTYKKHTTDSRIYNHIVVTGESTSATIPVFAESINDESSSPTNRAKLGDRVYQYSSSFITTTAQAQLVADNFLALHALEEYDLDLEAIVVSWLEAGDIIEFLDPDPNPGDPTRFLLTDFSIPVALGPMTLTGKRVQIV